MPATPIDINEFEKSVYARQYELAAQRLKALLISIDQTNGLAGMLTFQGEQASRDSVITTRLAGAIGALFADPGFQLSGLGYREIINWHRWIAAIFAASDFGNADHILQVFNIAERNSKEYTIDPSNILKFCLLYGPDSRIPLQVDILWSFDPVLAVGLCMALVSPRFLGSAEAHDKRELILPWLTERITELDTITGLPEQVLHDVYMHCSYAHQPTRHDIKRSLNNLISKWLHQQAAIQQSLSQEKAISVKAGEKPTMLVIIEWFTSTHSVYRTHSKTLEGCREKFRLVCMGYERSIDSKAKEVFDEFIEIKGKTFEEQILNIIETSKLKCSEVVYMPSVGMSPLTIFLSNLRLNPLQLTSWGHSASTSSSETDFYAVEDDLYGSRLIFSEKILSLPNNGMPHRSTIGMLNAAIPKRTDKASVNIAICASSMKINPTFLQTCKEIRDRTKEAVHFHFLIAGAVGLVYENINRVVSRALESQATIYPQLSFEEYLDVIGKADLFINPFPFGNCNSIVDCAWQNLIGVAMKGTEIFETIDSALFKRMGWPDWLIATNIEDYIGACIRLIENHEERQQLSSELSGREKIEQYIFSGDNTIMGALIMKELEAIKKGQDA